MKHTFLRPAAFLLAAGLLFCTLFAPAAAADEQKDLLSGTLSSAKSQYEQEQNALEELQGRQKDTEQRITQLEGRAGELQAQLAEVTDALQQAQTRLSEALAAEDAARRALAAKQAEYADALARCKTQMAAMQRLDGGGGIALLAQANNLYQLLSFASVLRQMSAKNSAVLSELDEQTTALARQQQQAEEAAKQAADARAALENRQAQLAEIQNQLAQALQQANETLSEQQAAALAQAAVTEQAKAAYQQAAAALDAYARAQSRKYTTPDLHCSLDFGPVLQSYTAITCRFGAPDAIDGSGHNGTDLAAPGGTPLYAAADGVVSLAAARPSYGNVVQLSHGTADDGRRYDTLYAHMQSFCVSAGSVVSKGQLIGYVGNTGDVRGKNGGYHLHLELRIDGVRTDALRMIPV